MKWQRCLITCQKKRCLWIWRQIKHKGERFILMLNSVMNIESRSNASSLPPERLWLSIDAVNHALKNYPKINFKAEKVRSSVRQKNLAVSALPVLTIQSQQKNRYRNFVSLLSILKEMFYFQLKLKDDVKLYWIYFHH